MSLAGSPFSVEVPSVRHGPGGSAKADGGRVSVQGAREDGTRFTIELPPRRATMSGSRRVDTQRRATARSLQAPGRDSGNNPSGRGE